MVERNIGALLIMEAGRPAGMFTERDALKCYARRSVEGTAVGEVMTRNLIIASPDDDVSYVSQIMIQKGIRHMPVIEGGHVVSVLSMRDVVKAQVSNLEAEVHYLKDFITETG
jgi:CBS domain-containing protein